jgi:D-alanyl-D-alanine carboxypeptidase (penicillin-binding protein 5/6)
VSQSAANAEGSAVGLLAGAKYTVDDLFQALMLVSGNDAAAALAQADGGIAHTVAAMNSKILQLGGYDTVVQTPSGLDGWTQLTSAYDMALVLRAVVAQPRLIAYDRLTSAAYGPRTSKYGSVGAYEFDNQSIPFLKTVPGALLAKIGFTDAARHTYLAADRRNGRTLGVIFLRDEKLPLDQYQQAAELFDWGFALKPTVAAVGVLAGPISAVKPAKPATSAAAATPAPHVVAAAHRGKSGIGTTKLVASTLGTIAVVALLLWGGGVAFAPGRVNLLRRRRRR